MDSDRVIRYLQNAEEARLFAFFLEQERIRHLKDIVQIDLTLAKIAAKFGVVIDRECLDKEVWTECPD